MSEVTRSAKGKLRIQGGCPCGWWAFSNCQYFQKVGGCRCPIADRPTPPVGVPGTEQADG